MSVFKQNWERMCPRLGSLESTLWEGNKLAGGLWWKVREICFNAIVGTMMTVDDPSELTE
jgi:hypothetical protein